MTSDKRDHLTHFIQTVAHLRSADIQQPLVCRRSWVGSVGAVALDRCAALPDRVPRPLFFEVEPPRDQPTLSKTRYTPGPIGDPLAFPPKRAHGFERSARRPCQQHTHVQQVAEVNWLTEVDE